MSSKQRNTQVGPDPETIPAKAPASSPALSNLLNSGFRDKAAACKSLTRFFATSLGFPCARACNNSKEISGSWISLSLVK